MADVAVDGRGADDLRADRDGDRDWLDRRVAGLLASFLLVDILLAPNDRKIMRGQCGSLFTRTW